MRVSMTSPEMAVHMEHRLEKGVLQALRLLQYGGLPKLGLPV